MLGVLEGGARLLPTSLSGYREMVQDPNARSDAMVASEEVPGWDLAYPSGTVGEQSYTTNRWRMRGPEYAEEKPENTVRIILVGDSSIFGHGLEWEDTMAAHLGTLRARRFPGTNYEVASCAAPGHSSVQSILKLERQCLGFEPDVVVIGNLNSDSTQWSMSDRERFHLGAHGALGNALQRSAFYRTVRNSWLTWKVRTTPATAQTIPQLNQPSTGPTTGPRVPESEYRKNLGVLAELARGAGAEPVFLVLPSLMRMQGRDSKAGEGDYRAAMREVAGAEGARVADADEYFAGLPGDRSDLFMDPVHPSARGAKTVAKVIDRTLGDSPP